MKNCKKFVILFSLLFVIFVIPSETFAAKKVRTIAVFFSMDANLPAYANLLEGIRSSLSEGSAEPYNLLTELYSNAMSVVGSNDKIVSDLKPKEKKLLT